MASITADSIAAEIFSELGSPCENTTTSISYWLRSRIGDLNTKIYTNFAAPTNGSTALSQTNDGVTSLMAEDEKSIFKQIYFIKYYEKAIRDNLGAASLDPIQEISSDGARIKKLNRNELSKSYLQLKQQAVDELNRLVADYKINHARATQVAGDDVFDNPNTIPIE